MNDQAHSLRNQMDYSNDGTRHAKTIAFISGKGGVGKSNIAINFGLTLAKKKYKVLMIDVDVGMGNIDILLGVQSKNTLVDMFENNLSLLNIIETGPENLSFIAGGSSFTNLFTLNDQHVHYFLSEFDILVQKYDYILFDMGAGITNESLFFILSSDEVMLITTPEPTAITDAYSMVKHLTKEAANLPIYVVMNRSLTFENGSKDLEQFERVVQSFLKRTINKVAVVPDDPSVREAVMNQQPFVLLHPYSQATKAIENMLQAYETGKNIVTYKTPLSFIHKMRQLWRERRK